MNPVKTPTQLRLTHDLLERADALIAVMADDPAVRALGLLTRTAVLRLAIARGLPDLEGQYQWESHSIAAQVVQDPPTGEQTSWSSHPTA